MAGEGLGEFRLPIGAVVYLPLCRLCTVNNHRKRHAPVLSAAPGIECGNVGGSGGGVYLGNVAGQPVEAVDLHLNGVEGAGGNLAELCLPILYGGGIAVAIGVGADHTQQIFPGTGIYLNNQLPLIFLNGDSAYGLQIFTDIVHISPHAACQKQTQQEHHKKRPQRRFSLLWLFNHHRCHIGRGFPLVGSGTFGFPQKLAQFRQLIIQAFTINGV